MNDRYRDLILKGVFQGGSVVPVTGFLKVDVTPFKLVSYDGLVIIETSDTQRLNVVAGQTNVVCLKVRYIDNDNVQTEWKVLEESIFEALTDKDYHVVFAKVILSSSATQVASSDISLIERDILDPISRSNFRGRVENSSDLPVIDNRLGDFYIIAKDGITPSIFAWDGSSWNDLTTAVTISGLLTQHRQNLFANEKHLTDAQQEAATGSAGIPSGTNKYVTEADYRLPTVPIRDALSGSDGTPSAANKYVTQQYPMAVPIEAPFTPPIVDNVRLVYSSSIGPLYVGTGNAASVLQWFNTYSATEDAELVTTGNVPVKIIGIFTNSALTTPLNPSVGGGSGETGTWTIDSLGFFQGCDLWIQFDTTPDTNFKLSFGQKKSLKQVNSPSFIPFLLLRGPKSAQADYRIFVLQDELNRERSPLRTIANGSDTKVDINSAIGERLDGTKLVYTLPDSSHQLDMPATEVDFNAGTISGTASGRFGTLPTMMPSWFVKAGLAVMPFASGSANDKLDVVFGLPAAVSSDATIPLWNSSTVPFSIITLQDNGSGIGVVRPANQVNVNQFLNPFLVTAIYDEEIEVTNLSGQSFFVYPKDAIFGVNSEQVLVMVNGAAKSVTAEDFIEVGGSAVQFAYDIPYLGRVRFRSAYAVPVSGQGGTSGITWATPVNANIVPQSHVTYNLGRIDKKFNDGFFGGDLTVSGVVNETKGIQFTTTAANPLTGPGIFTEMATGTLRMMDDNSNVISLSTADGHINTELNVQKEGISLRTDVQTINFVGSGVTVVNAGPKAVEIQITATGSGFGNLDGGSAISIYTVDAIIDGGVA